MSRLGDPDEMLAAGGCRLLSKQARERTLACSALDNDDNIGSSEGAEEENEPRTTARLIERIVKQRKSHCSASDFEMGFINRAIEAMKNNQQQQQ